MTALAKGCALIVVAVLGAACSGWAAQAVGSPAPSTGSDAAVGTPSPAATMLSLRSAGYRLTAPLQRSVAVAAGGSVLIAGGLDASDTTVGGVFSMDTSTGRLTSLGSLPQAVHDGPEP